MKCSQDCYTTFSKKRNEFITKQCSNLSKNLEKTKGLWNIHNRKGTNKHGPVRKRCIKVWLAKAK